MGISYPSLAAEALECHSSSYPDFLKGPGGTSAAAALSPSPFSLPSPCIVSSPGLIQLYTGHMVNHTRNCCKLKITL